MPTDTFNNLPNEKKEKIIIAAKEEFTRVPLAQVSIKNIAKKADISRGSFYQYFENKEDLLCFLLQEHAKKINRNLENTLKKSNGDLFQVFICIYDYMVGKSIKKSEKDFFKKLFEELKTSQDNIFMIDLKNTRPKEIEEYYDLVNKENLKINSINDFKLLSRMLHSITKKAVVCSFKYESKEKAREDFLKQLEYIKYGVIK